MQNTSSKGMVITDSSLAFLLDKGETDKTFRTFKTIFDVNAEL